MDRTWCSHRCNNTDCSRNYTDEERKRNKGGVDLPLCIGDMKTATCGYIAPKGEHE